MGHNSITDKQEKFAQSIAYKEYRFIWEAYAAHYNTKNMSQNTIYQEACRLRADRKVAARITEIEAIIEQKSIATLEEILKALTARVRLDVRNMFDADGGFKFIHHLSAEEASMLQEFQVEELWSKDSDGNKVVTGELKKVKFVDIKSVWDMFMKKFGAYITTVNHQVDDLSHLEEIIKGITDGK